jgi:hypothetical protein
MPEPIVVSYSELDSFRQRFGAPISIHSPTARAGPLWPSDPRSPRVGCGI